MISRGAGGLGVWFKDAILELRIQLELRRLLAHPDRYQKRIHAARMAGLIRQRSARKVGQMEQKAGLR